MESLMKPIFIVFFTALFAHFSHANNDCTNINKIPICHKGAGVDQDHKGVSICVDFGSLWGHIAQHPHDQIGECGVDVEENIKVWACNAGLRHKDHNDQFCFDLNNGGVIVANCSGLTSCLCSGDALPQRLNSFDYFSFDMANYYQGNVTSNFTDGNVTAGVTSYAQASRQQGTQILSSQRGVSFNLGSERFGSEYFVDLCYEVLDQRLKEEPVRVNVDLSLSADIFSGTQGYLTNALVSQRSGIFCDKSSFSGLGPYDYSSSPVYVTSETPFLGGTRSFNTVVSGARSCFTRLLFRENQNSILRPNELQTVSVNASLNVEPVNEVKPEDNGLRFCHVQRVQGNKYQCFQRDFPTTDALRTYMTTGYNNIPDWNQDHNKDYRGDCLSDCRPLTGAEANQ